MYVLEDILSHHKEVPFEGEKYSSQHPTLVKVSCWGSCVGIDRECTDVMLTSCVHVWLCVVCMCGCVLCAYVVVCCVHM